MTAGVPIAPAARITALPNYCSNSGALERLWIAIRGRLMQAGVHGLPDTLTWPTDLRQHWRDPSLLIGQTCGYPLVTELPGQVRVIGSLVYAAPGSQGIWNRSQLVVREDEPATRLEQFRSRTVAYNGTDSQSGYNALRALVSPLAVQGRFFGRGIESGSHLKSAEAVRDGLADIAAVDCVSLQGFRRYRPDVTQGLRVLGETDDYVGLPLITSLETDDATLVLLREVLSQTCTDPTLASLRAELFLAGFEPLDEAAYAKHLAMRNQALALGCPHL